MHHPLTLLFFSIKKLLLEQCFAPSFFNTFLFKFPTVLKYILEICSTICLPMTMVLKYTLILLQWRRYNFSLWPDAYYSNPSSLNQSQWLTSILSNILKKLFLKIVTDMSLFHWISPCFKPRVPHGGGDKLPTKRSLFHLPLFT